MPGQPFTKVVPGNGTDTVTFEVPAWYAVDMESVLARVDASGAGDTTATLTVSDEQGEQVATVPQGRVIAGGATGRATWALRLAAEQAPATGGSGIQFDIDNQGGFLRVFTDSDDGETNGIWLDTSLAPTARLLLTSGRDVELRAERDINVLPEGDLFASSSNGDATVRAPAGILRLRGGVNVSVDCSTGGIDLRPNGGDVSVVLLGGGSLFVYDAFGAPVFQVDAAGNLHGRTGGTLTFDL